MSAKKVDSSHRPYLIVGAGELISHVHRFDVATDGLAYRFNVFRVCSDGEVSHWLRPKDLRDVVKTCQVLAFSIADDGWVEQTTHDQLVELAIQLQRITDGWEQQDG